jgi:hypothetical protein
MSTLSWGAGGGQRTTNTAGPGDGWYTNNLALPDARVIYDGSRPIEIAAVAPTAGSGDRTAYYSVGTGWRTSGYHLIAAASTFSFRIARNSGFIYLALLLGVPGFNTYWLSGELAPSGGSAIQPGAMTYFQAPSRPGSTVTPNTSVAGRVDITLTTPSSNGGRGITGYRHQISRNSSFTDVIAEWTTTSLTTNRTGLPTSTQLYHRAMAINGVTDGVGKKGGEASTTRSFSLGTAPANPPTQGVVASPSGQSATITLAPPTNNGGSIITDYDVQYEYLSPPPIPGTPTVTFNTPAAQNVVTRTGLVPGASYRWRSRANNAIGDGVYTAWVTVVQPKPTLDPGDYFDGSSESTEDSSFSWVGTVNNSKSLLLMPQVLGWDVAPSSGTAVLTQVVGALEMDYGFAGEFSALVTFKTDTTAPGTRMGMDVEAVSPGDLLVSVTPGQEYFGSIHSSMARTQRVAAMWVWLDTGFSEVGTSVGVEFIHPADITNRATVQAEAPSGAAWGYVVLVDVAGTGWSAFLSGDRVRLDAAMGSIGELTDYFDGDRPDTAEYRYLWSGGAAGINVSTSYRVENAQAPIDLLADPDCPPVPSAPLPPQVPSTCIDEIGIWERYWLYVPEDEVSEWMSEVPTLRLQTSGFPAHQIRIRTYENPDDLLPENFDATQGFASEQIISYLPPNTTLTLDSITERAWAEVQGQRLVADQLLYGSEGTPATWPIFSCGISHLISIDTPVGVSVLTDLTLTRRQ